MSQKKVQRIQALDQLQDPY